MKKEMIYGAEPPANIVVKIERRGNTIKGEARTAQYVEMKTKQLREFGYTDLTKLEVSEQLRAIINGEKLNVIGMLMKEEVITRNKKGGNK